MATDLMTKDEAATKLLSFIFSGAIGSSKGKGVGYSLIQETPTAFSWSAALETFDGPAAPVDWYLVKIDRKSKEILPPELIALSEVELSSAILSATGQHLFSFSRFTDGALSISYRVAVREDPTIAYVVQLRHHGNVASMDSLMLLASQTADPGILPVPPVYSIPGEYERQEATGMGRQITRLVPGVIASGVYPSLSHDKKLEFVRRMALAFQACWSIALPEPRLIVELIATSEGNKITLRVGPDRHHDLGGPFSSVRQYLNVIERVISI